MQTAKIKMTFSDSVKYNWLLNLGVCILLRVWDQVILQLMYVVLDDGRTTETFSNIIYEYK
jgi:hypothetical protein